jgi:hypothetical protein
MRCRNPFLAFALSALSRAALSSMGRASPVAYSRARRKRSGKLCHAGAGCRSAQLGAKTAQPTPWQGSQLTHHSCRAEMYYYGLWGVSELRVKVAESGELIRFNYRVLDPAKAAALNDKRRSLS